MEFDEALHYMEGLQRFGWKLGNERFLALCERLGNPQNRYAVIHVTGTKGKGSTTALAAAMMHAHGFRTGGYFSPYVYDVRERVQVNGAHIPHHDFARLVTQIRPHIETLAAMGLEQTTEFELKTALGFLYFAEQAVDVACIEVGLGGRLDATNVVHPCVTVITNVGLDHTDRLGSTHAEIAFEKAGIIKTGIPCITAADHPEALAVIERTAAERAAPITRVLPGAAGAPTGDRGVAYWETRGRSDCLDVHTAPFSLATRDRVYPEMEVRMGGIYQRINAACATAACEIGMRHFGQELRLEAARQALTATQLPGRLEVVSLPEGPLVVIDGAHNALAAEALRGPVAELQRRYGRERTLLVIGMLSGHAPEGVVAALAPEAHALYACAPNWKRALPAEEIALLGRRFLPNVQIGPSVEAAVRKALRDAGPKDLVLITGSFYTIGEAPPAALRTWGDRG